MSERHLIAQRITDPIAKRVAASLYLKELAIISLITEGYRNKQIGARLNVGEGTVKNYCRNIYNATGMSSRVELAVFAVQHPESRKRTRPSRLIPWRRSPACSPSWPASTTRWEWNICSR